MEWVTQAAKIKQKRPPGSSRSIVESLNILNDVTNEGQIEINSIIGEADFWLKKEERILNTSNTGVLRNSKTTSMVSPERTSSPINTDKKLSSVTGQTKEGIQNRNSSHSGTPERDREKFPTTTPKSLVDDTTSEADRKIHTDNISNHFGKEETSEGETSIWSPFRKERSVKGIISASPIKLPTRDATEQIIATNSLHTGKINLEIEEANNEKRERKLNKVSKDRSQRRSNLFAPLPNKDPLVVRQGIPESAATNKSILSITGEEKPTNERISTSSIDMDMDKTTIQGNVGLTVIKKDVMEHEATKTNRICASNSETISKVTTSVFDRLSSLPTKSFENKKSSKPIGRKVSSSSFDVTGSPMRRRSFTPKSHALTDATIQETLKTIFSSNNNKQAERTTRPTFRTGKDRISKQLDIPNRIDRNSKPQFDFSENHKMISEVEKSQESKSPSIKANNFHNNKQKPLIESTNKSPVPKQLQKSTERNLISHDSLKHKDWGIKSTKSHYQSETLISSSNDESQLKKLKSHDRLTKFQLLPPMESEKDELKRKLDKRLSEVMRSQQDQHRRKQERQKRKSHLEEDYLRRTRLWNEVKENPSSEAPIGINQTLHETTYKVNSNSILHDLNVVDHRTIIGGESHERNDIRSENDNESANQTLPEINSDSDEETDYVIPSWAKPPYLQEQLYIQQEWDPKKIFGPLPPLHIDEIFQSSRFNRLKSRQTLTKKT